MEESKNYEIPNTKLRISFPKSSEDHRLQLVEINGSIFAIVHSPLESDGPIRLDCSDWSLVILAPIKSKSHVLLSAINIICLNHVIAEEGGLNVHASNQLVKFKDLFESKEVICERGKRPLLEFGDDPCRALFYYRMFEDIVSHAKSGTPDSFFEAQQEFIKALCVLADTIEDKRESLNIHKVLNIWNIPPLKL